MNTSKQPARMMYDNAYRHLRAGHHRTPGGMWDFISQDAERAADYSYQAYGYDDTGWTSDRRRKRFLEIKWRILSREELPF